MPPVEEKSKRAFVPKKKTSKSSGKESHDKSFEMQGLRASRDYEPKGNRKNSGNDDLSNVIEEPEF